MPTGNAIDFSFAVRRSDSELYHILNKTSGLVPATSVDSALLNYSRTEGRFALIDFLRDNLVLIIAVILFIALMIVLLLIRRSARIKRELNERVKMQSKLDAALSDAEHAHKAKTRSLNNMSHDIRTPMNAIIGFTDLAVRHIDNKEQVQDYLDKITVSSKQLLSIINDVLEMSRIESGKMTLNETEVHLPELIHGVWTVMQDSAEAKKLKMTAELHDVVSEDIITDGLRLDRVLMNVLSYSVKYTPDGGSVDFRITETPLTEDGMTSFEFRIKDNGIGMSKEFRETIFEAFTRERSSTVSGIQGTGLGMAITKNIVDLMNGTITVNSEPGQAPNS